MMTFTLYTIVNITENVSCVQPIPDCVKDLQKIDTSMEYGLQEIYEGKHW